MKHHKIAYGPFFRIPKPIAMTANAPASNPLPTEIGGDIREFHWSWKGKPITAVYEVLGEGKPILLLPAFSTISTRSEMAGVAQALAPQYQTITLDWIGFGQSDRPAINYSPAVYRAFLQDFVRKLFAEPVVVIAAGHAAGYVMELAQKQPAPWSWVVLTAPTWRGPLPTAMGEHRKVYKFLKFLIYTPILGQILYLLNTLPPFLRFMIGRHVYSDRAHITPNLMRQKWRTTQQSGARFASAAFVTGGLDPIQTHEEWLSWFQPLPVPALMAIGEQTPPKSRAEMEIPALFCAVQVYRMPGSLGLHEEYAVELVNGIMPFLNKYLS
jgi:pimeloyl-ACP methyl ester carboxylesterase